MERLGNTRPTGMNTNGLRTWGMLFILAGIISRSILQNELLGMLNTSGAGLLDVMQNVEGAMTMAAVALVLQAIETMAVPIFAFLLVEGFQHTSDYKKYLIRVAGLAVLSEIPFNLAMSQNVLDFSSRNPVFGVLLGLVLLYLYNRFAGQKLLCVVVGLMATVWSAMLNIEHGIPLVLMISVMWIFRNKKMFMGFSGAAVAVLCTGGSLFYLAAPMGFLVTHFYNGEPGEGNKLVSYLFYPVILLAVALIAMFAI